jgi:hypothetical protein
MALHHNTRISTSGLKFAYDRQNQKSWKGAATTNELLGETWWGDGTTQSGFDAKSVVAVTDPNLMYKGLSTYLWTPGTSKNCYLHSNGADVDNTRTSTEWTFSCFVRRDDGAAITSMNVYMYYPSSDGASAGTIIDVGGGWYLIYRVRTGASSYISLAGFTGMANTTKYYLSGVMLSKSQVPHYPTPVNTSRSSTESVIDLTRNTTATVSNLTYAADNTFSFDGSTGNITLDSVLTGDETTPFTLLAIAKTTSAAGWKTIIGTGGTLRQIGFNGTTFRYGINGGGGGILYNASAVTANQWYHVALTFDGTTYLGYLDNTQYTGSVGTRTGTITNHYLGTYSGSTEILDGEIQYAAIYDRTLSQSEISQHYNAFRERLG